MKNQRLVAAFLILALSLLGCVPETANTAADATPEATFTSAVASTAAADETPAAAATQTLDAPDLSGETLTIYQIADRASDEANYITPAVNGVADMLAHINTNGGVFGAVLELIHYETDGSLEQGVAAFEDILDADPVAFVVLVYDPWLALSLAPLAEEHQLPVLTTGASEDALYAQETGYVFSLAPTYSDQMVRVLQFLFEHWDAFQPVAVDTVNLAVFSWPAGLGYHAYTAEVADYLDDLGIQLVYTAEIPHSYTIDTTSQAVEANAALSNVIWNEMGAFGPARLLDDMDWVALRELNIVTGSADALDLSMRGFLLDQQHAAGAWVPAYTPLWTDDAPGIDFALANLEDNQRSPGDQTASRLVAQAGIDLLRHTLESFLLENELDDLDGAAFFEALTSVEDYTALDGLITYTYTDGLRAPRDIGIVELGPTPGESIWIDDIQPVDDWKE